MERLLLARHRKHRREPWWKWCPGSLSLQWRARRWRFFPDDRGPVAAQYCEMERVDLAAARHGDPRLRRLLPGLLGGLTRGRWSLSERGWSARHHEHRSME